MIAVETKERILETALELFAQNGYLGTSMSMIAERLGITKAALYKHYTGKQEILDRIVERMNELDCERAAQYQMPQAETAQFAKAYLSAPAERILAYSTAQFNHWTQEPFPADFRKMLTLEQYRDPRMANLYQRYLAKGPVAYMEPIFEQLTKDSQKARQLVLDFYGPIFLLYSIYDGAEEKESVVDILDRHVDSFSQIFQQKATAAK